MKMLKTIALFLGLASAAKVEVSNQAEVGVKDSDYYYADTWYYNDDYYYFDSYYFDSYYFDSYYFDSYYFDDFYYYMDTSDWYDFYYYMDDYYYGDSYYWNDDYYYYDDEFVGISMAQMKSAMGQEDYTVEEVFNWFDRDGSGAVDVYEYIFGLGWICGYYEYEPTEEDLMAMEQFWYDCDTDMNGELTLDEVYAYVEAMEEEW